MLHKKILKHRIKEHLSRHYNIPVADHTSFSSAVHQCFDKQYIGTLGSHIYSTPNPNIANDPVRGEKLWEQIVRNQSNYYIYNDEPHFIENIAKDVCQFIGEQAHIYDLGPGEEKSIRRKSFPFLKNIPAILGYYPLDISENFVNRAAHMVKESFPSANVKGHALNFQTDPLPVEHHQNGVILYLGSTISNLPGHIGQSFSENKAATKEFSRLRTLVGRNGHLILLHDSNQNAQQIISSYNHPEGNAFVSNILHKIHRDLDTENFDPESFTYTARWYQESSLLAHILISKCDQSFIIDGHEYHFQKGEEIFPVNSYKPTTADISHIAAGCGFKNIKTFKCQKDRLALHVLKGV